MPGVRAIPFIQTLLFLTVDLDLSNDKDRAILDLFHKTMINELNIPHPNTDNICGRTKEREIHLIIMRLLSVLMSRWKPNNGNNKSNSPDCSALIAGLTASVLQNVRIIDYCLSLLQALLNYWKNLSVDDSSPSIGGALLKEHLPHTPPDMQPFFLKQYVKGISYPSAKQTKLYIILSPRPRH